MHNKSFAANNATQQRHLIVSADEMLWKLDRPVVFLGEWCRVYSRRHIWEGLDGIVAPPYGLSRRKKDADHQEARAIETNILPKICDALNKFHNTDHGERYWQIVLGHWLRRFVDVVLNRLRTIEKCLAAQNLSGCTLYHPTIQGLARPDSQAANLAFSDNDWNVELVVRILADLDIRDFEVEFLDREIKGQPSGPANARPPAQSRRKKLILGLHNRLSKLLNKCVRKSDALILSTYLPVTDLVMFELSLGQVPQMWRPPSHDCTAQFNHALRLKLAETISGLGDTKLEKLIAELVFQAMPICYLEGFGALRAQALALPWPDQPKFIFTSNAFDTNELFKVWSAEKTAKGTKYFVGQHGNNYGTHRYYNKSVEEVTADCFITWGWADNLPQHRPAFLLKRPRGSNTKRHKGDGLLLIEVHYPHRNTTWDGVFEFMEYFQDQVDFIRLVRQDLRETIKIRLHSGYTQFPFSDPERWYAIDPKLNIDTGEQPISELVDRSKLVVHSYDSTGVLEGLAANIPTLAFWQGELSHLRDNAVESYQGLVDAGIVHFSAESVANKLNEIWDDIDAWWLDPTVQSARKRFCERYARNTNSPIHDLLEIFSE